jgi:hypothetical protein
MSDYSLEHFDLRIIPASMPDPDRPVTESDLAMIGRTMLAALKRIPVQEMTQSEQTKPEEDDSEETDEGDL